MLTQTFPEKMYFRGGVSLVFLFRNKETEPWNELKFLLWHGKERPAARCFFQREMNRCERLVFVPVLPHPAAPSCPERFLHREISPGLSCFLGSKTSQWVFPAFPAPAADRFFPRSREIREAKEGAMSKFNPFILLVIPVQSSSLIFLEETQGPFNLLEGRVDEPENEWIISKCRQSMGEQYMQCWPCVREFVCKTWNQTLTILSSFSFNSKQ